MNTYIAVLLGVVQGLTEFLPISSTAHLTLIGKLLGLIDSNKSPEWTAFLAIIQLGTLIAVLTYFARDVVNMALSLYRDVSTRGGGEGFRGYSFESRLALCVVAGTLPVAIIGFLAKRIIEGAFTKSTVVIICSLIVLALLLLIAERTARHTRSIEHITFKDAFVVGFAQVLALIPGSSRSGTTITASLFLGLTRPAAARFSFMLSIPAVLASGLYELLKIDKSVFTYGIENLVIATLVSAISGYLAISWLLRYLMGHTTLVFVWYRIGLGVVLCALLWWNIIGA